MHNLESEIQAVVNHILITTDLNVTGADKVLRDTIARTMATANKFERAPYMLPTNMRRETYDQLNQLLIEMRTAHFDKTKDIFAFVALTRSVGFTATDDRQILIEKYGQLIKLIEEDLIDWTTYIRNLFHKQTPWTKRFAEIVAIKDVGVPQDD